MRKAIIAVFILSGIAFLLATLNSSPALPEGIKIEKLVVLKSERRLQAFAGGKILKTYRIALGRNPVGDKQSEGDCRTPEGRYTISAKNPNSSYHKNLGISYPNASDLVAARKLGKPAGGHIKIHGMRNGFGFLSRFHRLMDWTYGCLAVTNAEVDELYEHTPVGTPIEILP